MMLPCDVFVIAVVVEDAVVLFVLFWRLLVVVIELVETFVDCILLFVGVCTGCPTECILDMVVGVVCVIIVLLMVVLVVVTPVKVLKDVLPVDVFGRIPINFVASGTGIVVDLYNEWINWFINVFSNKLSKFLTKIF